CAAALDVDLSKVYLNIDRYGNTSGASIPVAICEAWESGLLTPGDRLLLLAFGGGYTWGGAMIRWNLPMPTGNGEGSLDAGAEARTAARAPGGRPAPAEAGLGLGRRHRRQPRRDVPLHQARPAGDAPQQVGPDREHRVRCRHDGQRRPGELRGCEGGHRGL